jgi:hypothetical protein
MKDGFDRSVAERMPKMQKRRPNRPWNVDPVLIRSQEEVKEEAKEQPPARAKAAPEPAAQAPEASPVVLGSTSDTIARAVETIEDLHSEFSHIIFEKKDIQRKLMEHDRVIEEVGRENSTLRENLADLEKAAGEQKLLHKEITFLNEQIEDADHYIKHVVGMLEEKTAGYDSEVMKNRALEDRLARFSRTSRTRPSWTSRCPHPGERPDVEHLPHPRTGDLPRGGVQEEKAPGGRNRRAQERLGQGVLLPVPHPAQAKREVYGS